MDGAPQATHCEVIGLDRTTLKAGAVTDHAARRTITDFDNIVATLLAMNTHAFHTDYALAAQTQFARPLVVSPFLLSCLIGSVMADFRALPVLSIEIKDLKFTAPVHPGDTICARSRVVALDNTNCAVDVTGLKADGTRFAEFKLLVGLSSNELKRPR